MGCSPRIEVTTEPVFTAFGDAAAAAEAYRLVARGRRVRFVVRMYRNQVFCIDALDADPWAAGWQIYGRTFHPPWPSWMPMVLATGIVAPLLLWFAKAKAKANP
jgi:hypothetical protein